MNFVSPTQHAERVHFAKRLNNHFDSLRELYFRDGKSVREVMTGVLGAVDAADPNVWTERVAEQEVLDEADRLDRLGSAGRPLFGIPFSVKDNLDVAGMVTGAGNPHFGSRAERDAPVVAAMREAGAVLIGKNTMDEFATGLVGIRSGRRPLNPHDPERIPGGSSSGSGVAVALGLVGFALGSDTGGSGRVPAAVNGVVGWKPAPSSHSTEGMVYANRSFDCVPVFARNVQDAWEVTRAFPPRNSFEPALPSMDANVFRGDEGAPRVLAAPDPKDPRFIGDEACRAAFGGVICAVMRAGFTVQTVDWAAFADLGKMVFESGFVVERANSIGYFVRENPDKVDPSVREIVLKSDGVDAASIFDSLYELQARRRIVAEALAGTDALIVPTVPAVPRVSDVEDDPIALNHLMGTYTYFANLLDLSVCAFPAGWRSDQLPFGVSMIVDGNSECRLKGIVDVLEKQFRHLG